MKLEELNAKAKKVGLHVAPAENVGAFTIRTVSTGKLVAKNAYASEVLEIIESRD